MPTPHVLLLHALSPLHFGTGAAVGGIDLPIAREMHTGFPVGPGSGIKGALRSGTVDPATRTRVFGPEPGAELDSSGSVAVGDARLLLLPVRSMRGTFAYVTSPLLLRRFAADAREAGCNVSAVLDAHHALRLPRLSTVTACAATARNAPVLYTNTGKLFLEELELDGFVKNAQGALDQDRTDNERCSGAQAWAVLLSELLYPEATPDFVALRELFVGRFVIVHDDVMAYLSRHATQVDPHVQLERDAKVVAHGPWYEESLPPETVLVSLVAHMNGGKANSDEVNAALSDLSKRTLVAGGSETTGKGRIRLVRHGG